MKRMVHVIAVVILVIGVTVAFAGDKAKVQPYSSKAQAKAKVDCCMKGQCIKAESADQCAGAGGKVVKNCAECK